MPALTRALVACGCSSIQTLFGGIAVHLMLAALFDSWAQLGGGARSSFWSWASRSTSRGAYTDLGAGSVDARRAFFSSLLVRIGSLAPA